MLFILILTFLFIIFKSYVLRFDNFRHTIVNDKDSASIITPNYLIFISLFAWILDFVLIYLAYTKWSILITIIFTTIINLIPKFLSFIFPFPNYVNFLKESKKLLLKNTKQEYLDHPTILSIIEKIETNLQKN